MCCTYTDILTLPSCKNNHLCDAEYGAWGRETKLYFQCFSHMSWLVTTKATHCVCVFLIVPENPSAIEKEETYTFFFSYSLVRFILTIFTGVIFYYWKVYEEEENDQIIYFVIKFAWQHHRRVASYSFSGDRFGGGERHWGPAYLLYYKTITSWKAMTLSAPRPPLFRPRIYRTIFRSTKDAGWRDLKVICLSLGGCPSLPRLSRRSCQCSFECTLCKQGREERSR